MTLENPDPLLQEVINGQSHFVWSLPNRLLKRELDETPKGILSGSFNPLHEGHKKLRDAAEQWLNGPVFYELPITNADKHPLNFQEISHRRHQFETHPLALTNAPTFVQKAEFLQNVTFVVGFDTAERIIQSRYYGGEVELMQQALVKIRNVKCQFLVAGRIWDETFLTLSNLPIPIGYEDLFEELPESAFRQDVSSTEHRPNSPLKKGGRSSR
jgi:hypothetical protein